MAIMTIEEALNKVKERGFFREIVRYQYKDYDVQECLRLVEQVGKQRTPRFVIDDENRFAYENFIKWLIGDGAMKALHPETKEEIPGNLYRGIYIAGNTGSGKSWCMEVMRAFADVMRFRIDFGTDICRIWWKEARADEIVAHYVTDTSIEPYKDAKILCIQDFGSEPLEAVSMGNRMNVLRYLLEWRGDHSDRLTLITSNLSLKNQSLVECYGDRVASRLVEMCNYFEIKGKDRRKY